MAIVYTNAGHTQLMAYSTDDKPLTVENGTKLYIVDTGEEWIFFDGMWILDIATAAVLMRAMAAV